MFPEADLLPELIFPDINGHKIAGFSIYKESFHSDKITSVKPLKPESNTKFKTDKNIIMAEELSNYKLQLQQVIIFYLIICF